MILITYLCVILFVSNDTPAAQAKDIFILAGQSNMSGRGGVVNETRWDGVVPPQCRPNASILQLSAGSGQTTWVVAQEPLHQQIDAGKVCGVGPGMAFANAVVEKDSSVGVVGLVPCAVGGTNISEWGKGSFLYEQMVARARAALRVDGDGDGRIRALLWYQGESDTVDGEDARLYGERLRRFFTDIRSDLYSPVLPIIQVALASGEGPYVERVREAQLGMDLVNVRCVDAKGLELQPDGLHLTTMAQVRLGELLADAFLRTTLTLPTAVISSTATSSTTTLFAFFPFLALFLFCQFFVFMIGFRL